jgi:8-oxo-dGTP pyrophosphatase MutT (NUDIX family)
VPRAFDADLRATIVSNLRGFETRAMQKAGHKLAAVAVALVANENGEACFILTRRAARLSSHRGQWALPGGRIDPRESAADAALRELSEEVGLAPAPDAVLGVLDDYATRSGYVITPAVIWCGQSDAMRPNPQEVAAAYRVPVAELEHPDLPHVRTIPESDRPVISIPLLETHIHAPTAAVLYQFREVALLGRPTRVDHYEQPVFAWR